MVQISSAAIAEIERIKLSRQVKDLYLRLMVKSGGCLDFFYDLKIEVGSKQTHTSPESGDRLIEVNGINLAIDSQSWQYVESLKIDYAEDLMGGGFRFHNSQHQHTCGCGISFKVESTS